MVFELCILSASFLLVLFGSLSCTRPLFLCSVFGSFLAAAFAQACAATACFEADASTPACAFAPDSEAVCFRLRAAPSWPATFAAVFVLLRYLLLLDFWLQHLQPFTSVAARASAANRSISGLTLAAFFMGAAVVVA